MYNDIVYILYDDNAIVFVIILLMLLSYCYIAMFFHCYILKLMKCSTVILFYCYRNDAIKIMLLL